MKFKISIQIIGALLMCCLSWPSLAQLPEDFFETALYDFNNPVGVTTDERGFTYVWEKAGTIWLLDSADVRFPEPFLDLSEEVASWRDHGLLGVALDPDFLFNGYVYCLYTVDRHHLFNYGTSTYSVDSTIINQATIGRISRFTADPSSAFTSAPYSSRKVLLGHSIEDGIPIPNNLHGVGSLDFGDDGSLLASTGDGGPDVQPQFAGDFHIDQAIAEGITSEEEHVGPFRAQILECLNGKILRLDPETGMGLSDNPFFEATNPTSVKSKIWTLGIRNPYRMKIIPGTGVHEAGQGNPGIIVFGDVGEAQWEEINFITGPGQNCGWPIYEGYDQNWTWSQKERANRYAPNPLYNTNNCDQEFFNFQDLLLPANSTGNYFWENPCAPNQEIPETIEKFHHHWPILDYSNLMFNAPPRGRTAIFDENGKKTVSQLTDPSSTIKGDSLNGFSAIAGFWYDSGQLPETYNNSYWIGDYSGWIKILKLDEDYKLIEVDTFTQFDRGLVDLTFNKKQQAIYYVDLSSNKLYKIGFGVDPPPVIVTNIDTLWGTSPLNVQFDASASYHPKDVPFEYFWDFGDGTTSTLAEVNHTFTSTAQQMQSFNVKLILTDTLGKSSEKQILVSLNNSPPTVKIASVANGDLYPVTSTTSLRLVAEVNDPEHTDGSLKYRWQTFLHHNAHFHPEPIDTLRQTYTLIDPLGCEEELYYFRIRLSVSDPEGLTSEDEIMIFPDCNTKTWDVDLKGAYQESSILLSWDLPDLDSLQDIIIQRVTSNAEDWNIGTITPSQPGTYTFEDLYPINGINQYRLQFNHQDGTYSYSNFASLLFPNPPPTKIFPNPAQEEINVQLSNLNNQPVSWKLFANDGRLLRSGLFNTSMDNFSFEKIDLSFYQSGVYFLEIKVGENTYGEQIILKK